MSLSDATARPAAPSRLAGLPVALAALFCLACLVCVIGADWIAPYGEADLVAMPWQAPDLAHPLGTDQLGRDMLSRIIFGARTSIGLSLAIVTLAFAVGGALGLAAVTLGGWADAVISRIVDLFMALPPLVLALLALSVSGTSLVTLTLTAAFIASLRVFRLTRSLGIDIAARDFVDVARLRRDSTARIMWREILPNAAIPLISEFGLRFVFAFLFVASLSFLGLGVQPPMADWGGMVRENVGALNYGRLTPLVPAGFIALLAISVNLIGDWLVARRGGGR
ncbi:ABC transporter permease [Ancylobacter defluvii]|uniref:ABC transporter permease n=1 Tax=Ancylobacter defluvii TaxID=1282440 RepID=A0A9W6NAP6_9HYPH|nr:ABC transporter permease [Ancylobacter defluvii]MBS7588520.1 ABC transporter permease [Ancylobacter defluvii]GLK83800.1 ABC transporter permease [Ancylobacter defluvii]